MFWLAGSSAWAQGVSDLKYYLHPDTIFKILYVCSQEGNECETVEDGSYGTLNASLVNIYIFYLFLRPKPPYYIKSIRCKIYQTIENKVSIKIVVL